MSSLPSAGAPWRPSRWLAPPTARDASRRRPSWDAEAELCYAPQFGAAKDPVNLAGMIAANHLRGDLPLADWSEFGETEAEIVDVRTAVEFKEGHLPQARNIPLEELRGRLDELPADREIHLVCGVGQRAYYATRALLQRGFDVLNLPGGMKTYRAFKEARGGE